MSILTEQTNRFPEIDKTERPVLPHSYLSDRLTDFALEFIRESGDRPFLLVLSHYAVHTPIQAKDSLIAKYASVKRLTASPASKMTTKAVETRASAGSRRTQRRYEVIGPVGRTRTWTSRGRTR